MADQLPSLLKIQHQEVLDRLDTLMTRVEQFLRVDGTLTKIKSDGSASDSVPSGHLVIPPAMPKNLDASETATPAGSGQVTPKKRRIIDEAAYQEAKEEGQRVEYLKRKQSAEASLHPRSHSAMAQSCGWFALAHLVFPFAYRSKSLCLFGTALPSPCELRSALGPEYFKFCHLQCAGSSGHSFELNFSWAAA